MSFGIDHILEGSQEAAEWLSSTLHTEGYAVLKVSDQYRRLFDSLASETKNFFASISAEERDELCCENSFDPKARDRRDRLELRANMESTGVVVCGKRDQFVNGFDLKDSSSARATVTKYFPGNALVDVFQHLERVGQCVCKLLCDKIGVDIKPLLDQEANIHSRHITDEAKFSSSVLRLLRYPSGSSPGEVLAQDHTDIGLVTLMPCSNVPSLQVLNKSFEWVEVENKDNDRTAIIVCVGEQMAFLSNYYYEPSRHRIVRSLGRSIETSIRVTKRSDTMPQ